jgi:hypothetical protein
MRVIESADGPVAELADAHGLGPCGFTPVKVRVLSGPPSSWHSLAHFSDHGMAHFTLVYFPSK